MNVVLDREPDQEKSLDPTGSSHPLPALRLVATQRGQVVLHLWQ